MLLDREAAGEPERPGARTAAASGKPISAGDGIALFRIALASLVVWLVPQSRWRALSAAIARGIARLQRHREAERIDRVRAITGSRALALPVERVPLLFTAAYYENLMLIMAHYRPWTPHIETRLAGGDQIDRALERGRGVILWNGNLVFNSVVQPIALSRAGYRSHHLARRTHGFSATRAGMRFLNPIQTAVEDRYLASRILMGDNPLPAFVAMQRRLRRNEIVSLTAHEFGVQILEVPFGDGRLRIASGAVELALLTGATLLPAFTRRDEQGHYETRVLPPLHLPQHGDRETVCRDAVLRCVRRMEAYVMAHPEQWICWYRQARPSEAGEDRGVRRIPGL